VLCFHTSHRHLRVDKLIASVADDLGYACRVGQDVGDWPDERGSFTSQWVVVARRGEELAHLTEPAGYKQARRAGFEEDYWNAAAPDRRFVWRDGAKNSYSGLWLSDPLIARLHDLVRDAEYRINPYIGHGPARKLMEPIHERLGTLDELVTHVRNK
jgi:hypothetical protein